MSVAALLELIRVVDSLLALLAAAGVNMAKLQAMREQNADGHLSAAQVEMLAEEARESVRRLG